MFASNSGAEMDPHTARLLDDLKQLLREKVITLVEYRAEVAALHDRALMARPAPEAVKPAAPAPAAEMGRAPYPDGWKVRRLRRLRGDHGADCLHPRFQ